MTRSLVWRAAGWLAAACLSCGALAGSYTVKAGDTMYSLARSVGLTVGQFQELNRLTTTDLKVGQVLTLPEAGSALPTPAPASPTVVLRPAVRVSAAGCCVNAAWSADSRHLLLLDRPFGQAAGIYSLPADGAGAATLVWPPTLLSSGGAYGLQPSSAPASALAVRLSDGRSALVPTSGRDAVWSPGGALAWPVYGNAERNDWIPLTVFAASPFGSGPALKAAKVVTVYGGRLVGWLDDATLLLTGRLTRNDALRSLLSAEVVSGKVTTLAQGQVFSGVQASPDGAHVAYRVTLDAPGLNGTFLADLPGKSVVALPVFGSMRWQDAQHLLLVPYEPGAASQRLMRLDVATGEMHDLLALNDRISADDWRVSPDGSRAVYLSAVDRSLQVLTLPAAPEDHFGSGLR